MLAILTVLVACGPTGADGGCAPDVEAGTAEATVDGEAWTGPGVTWREQGTSSIQITSTNDGGWWLSLVAQTTTDGTPVPEAIDAGTFPIEVSLVDGGWALFYRGSDSWTSKEGEGELVVAGASGDTLDACFSFTAESDGDAVTVESGALAAVFAAQ